MYFLMAGFSRMEVHVLDVSIVTGSLYLHDRFYPRKS